MADKVEPKSEGRNVPEQSGWPLPHRYWAARWLVRMLIEDFEKMAAAMDEFALDEARAPEAIEVSGFALKVATKAYLAANDRKLPALVALNFIGAIERAASLQHDYANGGPPAPGHVQQAGEHAWIEFCQSTPWCPREVKIGDEPIACEIGRLCQVWELNHSEDQRAGKLSVWPRIRELLCVLQREMNLARQNTWLDEVPSEGRLADLWRKERLEVQQKKLKRAQEAGTANEPLDPL